MDRPGVRERRVQVSVSEDKRICLGKIADAHGIRGELRIRTYTEAPEDISAYGPLENEAGDRRFSFSKVRLVKDGIVARLEGIKDRTQAESLKGTLLFVDRARLPEQDDGVWYHTDLIGLAVIDANGATVGEVVSVQNYGAGDLLEIRPEDGSTTLLVPFTEDVVPTVDIAGGSLSINPPEGLLEK